MRSEVKLLKVNVSISEFKNKGKVNSNSENSGNMISPLVARKEFWRNLPTKNFAAA